MVCLDPRDPGEFAGPRAPSHVVVQPSTSPLGIMVLLISLAGAVAAITLPAWLLSPLRRARFGHTAMLRSLNDEQLAARVFRFEPSYFKYIGPSEPTVLEFRMLVETRDIQSIDSRWRSLQRAFQRLERRVGHRGRPLILDYYCWYGRDYRELLRRSGETRAGRMTPNNRWTGP